MHQSIDFLSFTGMPAKPHLGGDSFASLTTSSAIGHSTGALDIQGHASLTKQQSIKSNTIPMADKNSTMMGGGAGMGVGGSSVARPTRLTQPEKLLQLAATTQLGRLADKYSPHGQSNNSMKEKKGKND